MRESRPSLCPSRRAYSLASCSTCGSPARLHLPPRPLRLRAQCPYPGSTSRLIDIEHLPSLTHLQILLSFRSATCSNSAAPLLVIPQRSGGICFCSCCHPERSEGPRCTLGSLNRLPL